MSIAVISARSSPESRACCVRSWLARSRRSVSARRCCWATSIASSVSSFSRAISASRASCSTSAPR
ncbi:hypothetical protein ACFQV4_14690 [Streptomyces thermocarboxydus]